MNTRELMNAVAEVAQEIDAAYAAQDLTRDIQCPLCGANLGYGKAVMTNGHRHAFCSTEGCDFSFTE